MKRITIILLTAFMTVPAFGQLPITRRTVSTSRQLDLLLRDRIGRLDTQVAALQAGGSTSSAGTTYYVDSANGADTFDGKTWTTAKATVEAAFGIAALTAGDTIELAAGGTEAVGGADGVDMDVAGVYVKSWGTGTNRYAFTYDAAADEVVIGADDIIVENVQLVAGVTSITMGISIEAVDNITLINCFAPKPTTNSWEFLDTIDVADGANNILIYGFEAYNDEAGAAPAHFIDAGNGTAGPTRLQIARCIIKGDFSVSAIWSDEPCDEAFITNNTITNHTSAQHCIEFTDTGTGVISFNSLFTDASATTLDPGSMYCFENYVTTGVDASGVIVPAYDDTANNLLGVDDAANLGLTTNVVSDGDGSVLERLEFVQAQPATDVATNYLGVDDAANLGTTAAVVSDPDGSALERLEWLELQSNSALAQAGIDTSTVNVFYVDSVAANGGAGISWATSEDTLKAAVDDATDSTGAVILLAANHAETIAASVAIDCPGITIIGLGVGNARPTLTFSATASDLAHTVANVKYKNILFVSGTADSTAGITLDGSSDGAIFEDCEFRSTSGFEFLSSVTLATAADNVRFTRCKFNNATGGTNATEAIQNTAGVTDGMTVEDCEFYGAWTAAAIFSDDADTDVVVRDNLVQNTSTGIHAIEFSAAALGTLSNNLCYADTLGSIIDPGSLKCFGNKEIDTVDGTAVDSPLVIGQTYVLSKAAVVTGTTEDLFLVAGGPIEVISMFGECTTVMAGSPGTCVIQLDSADDDYDKDFTTTVNIDALAAGDSIRFTDAIDESVLGFTANVGAGQRISWFINVGTIEQTLSSTGTGGITWYMTFRPLATGVSVTVQ